MIRKKLLVFGATLVLFCALALGAFDAKPWKGTVVSPMDLIMTRNAWRTVTPYVDPHHWQHSDSVDSQIPTWNFYRDTLRKGQLPLWNPTNSGGVPGILNLTSEIFSPFFWPYVVSSKPGFGFYAGLILKLVVAGTGVFWLLRNFLGWWPAAFGGIIYMLCGFHSSWLMVPATSVTAWIPWLLWATCRFSMHRRWTQLFAIYAFTFLLVTAGFPSVAAFGLYAVALCGFIFFLFSRDSWKNRLLILLLPYGAISLAFASAAIPLAALLSQLGEIDLTYRAKASTILTKEYFEKFWDPLSLNGLHVEMTMYVGRYPLFFAFVGAIIIILAPLTNGVTRFRPLEFDRNRAAFAAFALTLSLISVVIAFGLVNHDWIRMLPVFSFNPWSRMISLLDLGLALLAGIGLNVFFQKNITFRFAPILAGCLGLWLCTKAFRDERTVMSGINGASSVDWFYPPTPTTDFIKNTMKPLNGVLADRAFLIGGVINGYGFFEWFAHDFKSNDTKRFLDGAVDSPWLTPTAAGFEATQIKINSPHLDLLGIRYLVMDSANEANVIENAGSRIGEWTITHAEKGISIFEKKTPSQLHLIPNLGSGIEQAKPMPEILVEMPSPQQFTFKTGALGGEGYLLLPLHHNKDWTAYVDGEKVPVGVYQGVFPALPLKADAVYSYRYEPGFLLPAILVTLASILAMMVFLLAWGLLGRSIHQRLGN